MRISIKNFGPISYYEFDLKKDLHLIVGENNVGKSYAITVVYLLIKNILQLVDEPFFPFGKLRSIYEPTETKITDVSCNSTNLDVTAETLTALKKGLEETFLLQLQDSFAATFDSLNNLQNQFSNEDMAIGIHSSKLNFDIGIANKNLIVRSIDIHKKVCMKSIKQNRHFKENDTEYIVYCTKGDSSSTVEHLDYLIWRIFFSFVTEVSSEIKSVHYLPASRSGLYQALSAFGQIIAELSKSRAFLTKKIELPGISEPLSDYFIKLSEINLSKRDLENNKLDSIAKRIEAEILKGKVDYDFKTKRLIYTPERTQLKLDLSSTSSMVSELSPIVSYLRYVIGRTDRRSRYSRRLTPEEIMSAKPLVIIEEPEAHLHPEIQIKIMDVFAELISKGVKIILTSHSNYIFNKTNNLILDKRINIDRIQASVFRMKNNGSVGDVIETDELGINDENFIDVADQLYQEKIHCIERINANV